MTAHDSWAKVYDRAYKESFGIFYKEFTELTLKVIQEETAQGLKVIDFGAGTGRLSCPLSELGFDVTAVDSSLEMLKELQSKDIKNRIKTHNEFMENFISNERYDFALCVFSVLTYLTDEQTLNKALSNLKECLHSGGLVLMDIPLPGAFKGLTYKSETLHRDVIVDKQNDVFNYQESIDVLKGNNWVNYSDEFKIRCWQSDLVLNKIKQLGFNIQKDLSEKFLGTGALYFLFKLN
mgnify:FL=1